MALVVSGATGTFLGSAVASSSFQGDAVQDTAALTALLPEQRFDKQERYVEDDKEEYFFDLQSPAGSSPPDILVPDDSPAAGRWLKHKPSGGVPASHAASHSDGGSDEVTVENLATSEPSTTKSLMSDGAGGLVFGAPAPGAHASTHEADTGSDALSTAAAGAVAIGDAAAVGTAETLSRSDHQHSLAAPAAPADVTKATAATGSAVEPARADHKHDVSTAAPSDIGTANAEGAATSLARSDHVHDHGTQTDGTLHADVIAAGADGFMTGTDKTKLDGVATGADVTGSNAPQAHGASHVSGGGDALLSTDLLEAIVKRLQTSTGPTTLLLGAIADGEFLKRSGTDIVGDTPRKILIVSGSQDVTVASGDLDVNITGFTGIKRVRRAWFWITENSQPTVGVNTQQPVKLSFFAKDTFVHFIDNADPSTNGQVVELAEFFFVVQDVKVGINNGVSSLDIDDTDLYSAGLLIRLVKLTGPTHEFQRIASVTDADTLAIEDTIQTAGTPAFAVNDDVALVLEVGSFEYEDQDGTGEIHMRISPGDTGGNNIRLHWHIEFEDE